MKKPGTKKQARAVRLRFDITIGFDHLFNDLPPALNSEMIGRLRRVIVNELARENIGVVEMLPGGDTEMSIDFRYQTIPTPGEATPGPDAPPVSRMRKTPLKDNAQ